MLIETPPLRLGRFEPDLVAVRRGIAKAVAAGESWLDAEDTTAILAAYGITVAQPRAGGTGAAELFAGLVEDPVFGPLVAFGQAGAAVGILHDTSDLPMRWPSRLSQLDYDWELALLAVHEEAVLGAVRYSADPGREKAEYAIAVSQRLVGTRSRMVADDAPDRDRPAARHWRARRRGFARERADAADVPRVWLRDHS